MLKISEFAIINHRKGTDMQKYRLIVDFEADTDEQAAQVAEDAAIAIDVYVKSVGFETILQKELREYRTMDYWNENLVC